jgi:prepilin-type N-terminal cleavage/methylation domain-containing protein
MHPSRRAGFTLIELMIVVVIIGVLAAIAIPSFMNTKDKAYLAGLNADIHRFASVEESYYADHGTYTDDATMGFTTTVGNVTNMGVSGVGGWSAEIYSTKDSRARRCGLRIGNVAPVNGKILTESQVYCYAP